MTSIRKYSKLPLYHQQAKGVLTPKLQRLGVTEINGDHVKIKADREVFKEYEFGDGVRYFGVYLTFEG